MTVCMAFRDEIVIIHLVSFISAGFIGGDSIVFIQLCLSIYIMSVFLSVCLTFNDCLEFAPKFADGAKPATDETQTVAKRRRERWIMVNKDLFLSTRR